MTSTLKNNAFALNRAMESGGHCAPASAICRDGSHDGTLFTWLGTEWAATDLENRKFLGFFARLAVVTLNDADADDGLNQIALGCDFEVQNCEWVVDALELEGLRECYGDALEILWEQE